MNAPLKEKVLYRAKTAYNDIWVTKEGTTITLYSPSSYRQTAINERNPFIPHLEYARNTILGLVFYPAPQSILVLGLGGGSIPMMYHNFCTQTHIDVVEIDPEIAVIAKTYFHFITLPSMQLHIDDAYNFVKKITKSYDIIILDTYIGNEFPRSLSTTEFISELKRLLSTNGILIANVISSRLMYFKKMLKKNGFMHNGIWLLPGTRSKNIVVFASNKRNISKDDLFQQTQRMLKDFPYDFQLMNLIRKLIRP